jgi:hypothetical protein
MQELASESKMIFLQAALSLKSSKWRLLAALGAASTNMLLTSFRHALSKRWLQAIL